MWALCCRCPRFRGSISADLTHKAHLWAFVLVLSCLGERDGGSKRGKWFTTPGRFMTQNSWLESLYFVLLWSSVKELGQGPLLREQSRESLGRVFTGVNSLLCSSKVSVCPWTVETTASLIDKLIGSTQSGPPPPWFFFLALLWLIFISGQRELCLA